MTIVGMGDTAVQEARERVKAAIRSSGYSMPPDKIVVNLAPGDLKKSGPGFDLPIAVGILVATGQVDGRFSEGALFVGELSLRGEVREFPGYLAFGLCARHEGCKLVCASEIALPIDGLEQVRLTSLAMLRSAEAMEDCNQRRDARADDSSGSVDFRDIAGHEVAKRALQIATAGSHGLLMCGPPGSGKTMLASRVPSILPPLSEEERLESAVIHSVAGEPIDPIIGGNRPFRNPHHSATMAGMLGGGNPVRPGEVTLAHNGVLFLDELAEFSSSVLQGLRQPIESHEVLVTRASGSIRMPASFLLIAATNPCPCGHYGDEGHECTCTAGRIAKYQGRVGGPLIDRFRMQLDVRRLPSDDVLGSGSGTSSEALREGVLIAREFADWRRAKRLSGSFDGPGAPGSTGNISLRIPDTVSEIVEQCSMDDRCRSQLVAFSESENMSGRSLVGLLKVARTIADMEQSACVGIDHVAEAMGYRLSETFGGA